MKEVIRYTKDLLVEHDHGKFDRLIRTLGYNVAGVKHCAVKGMLTDYSSTPGIYDAIVEEKRVRFAGVIHDAAYQTGTDCEGRKINRSEADMVWRLVAQHGDYSANAFQAWLGWTGLRAGGWLTWRKYRKTD